MTGGFQVAARLVRGLTWAQLAMSGVLFILALGLYTAEVVMRTGFSTGYPEYYEVVGYAFIYVFLFGAGALYARNEDIMIEAIYQHLGQRAKAWLELVVYVTMAVTMVIVGIHTWILIGLQMNTPTPLLEVPESVKWFPLLFLCASIAFTSAIEAWGCVIWIARGTRPLVWTTPPFDVVDPNEKEEVL
jgi:TRAP-type C4-dicarboxylate transport system permease small subunit